MVLLACSSIPEGKSAIDEIDVVGNEQLSDGQIQAKLASKESGRFLWLFQGLFVQYEVFNQHVLEKDLQRVERFYAAHGFNHARVRAGRVFKTDEDQVRIEIHVQEGPPTLIESVRLGGVDGLPASVRESLEETISRHTGVGQRFEEEELEKVEDSTTRVLKNSGYAYAKVETRALVDMARNSAVVVYEIEPHNRAFFGKVTITGLGKIPEGPVRQALAIKPGDAYSQAELEDAKQALLDLGVFAAVDIEPQLDQPPPPDYVVPVKVIVSPANLKAVKLGGGVQLDAIQTDVHALAGWEHLNLFGGLRKFSIEARPGIVLYPTRVPSFSAPQRFLPEVRLDGLFEQPGFLEPRTVGILRAGYDIFAVLFIKNDNPEAPIIGYREARTSAALRRRFWKLTLSPSFNMQTATPFAYAGELSAEATSILILHSELLARLELRDNPVAPTKGAFASLATQYANFGSDAHDVRLKPDVRFYIPLPSVKANIALRGVLGFLFPFNYETYQPGRELTDPPSVKDTQVAYFRSFFSGGPNSNRGYPFREVGPHGPVEFFNPALASEQGSSCDPQDPAYDEDICAFPLGGRSLWEASAALRFKISQAFSSSLFCDGSDVLLEQLTLRFDRPHVSCGTGLRYATPVGPIRFDLAYRIPGLQVLTKNGRVEGDPGDILGIPVNVSFGIGEAF